MFPFRTPENIINYVVLRCFQKDKKEVLAWNGLKKSLLCGKHSVNVLEVWKY